MAGKTLDVESLFKKDDLACRIGDFFTKWQMMQQIRQAGWKEVKQYVYATDTSQTSNSTLPWKNTTTIPKLTQIADNLYANYIRSLFPKRKWASWISFDKESAQPAKRKAIENFMYWCIDRSNFKGVIEKALQDWIVYGNAFVTVEWRDNRTLDKEGQEKPGYVGPAPVRISPLDIMFNPIAPSFNETPKILRDLVSIGEVKSYLERISTDENKEANEELWKYLKELRQHSGFNTDAGTTDKNTQFQIDGFDSWSNYLSSNFAEVLTFYGDIYDIEKDKFYKNYKIMVVDRHKILSMEPVSATTGISDIHHNGWRVRQDNLWAMGPLDNLIGMQYRIDHLENLKADIFDLTAFPVLKIKGYVEDFEWGPLQRIYLGDDGDVEMVVPDVNALNANVEINMLEQKMEEMAGAPKEALGFRTPGEKTAYEVQRLENAASRIFQSKIQQFEENIIEPLLNSMLDMAKRNMPPTMIRIFDDEFKVEIFQSLTADDISGNGRIVPMAARHFAETSEKIQNITSFYQSGAGQDKEVLQHFSSLKLAEMFEDLLDLEGYELVTPFVRISEQADSQRQTNAQTEQVETEAVTPSGLTPDDFTQ